MSLPSPDRLHLSRRSCLRRMGALAALAILPEAGCAQIPPGDVPLRHNPFTLGVASGSPATDGFVLWTRLMGEEIPLDRAMRVQWELFEPDNPNRIIQQGVASAPPELAHSVHVELHGLPPDHWFGYRFRLGAHVSDAGRTRTLPALHTPTATPLRFAYVSCQHWEHGHYAGYRHMLDEGLDCVVFVGDYIYEYASSSSSVVVRQHHQPMTRTLDDYRARYAIYKSDPWLQRMHAHCPWLLTWDDHEVENDYIGLHSISGTENFPAVRSAAYQAYYEHQPLRASTLTEGMSGLSRGAELKIYDRCEWGQLATFHLLDGRQYRDAPVCRESFGPVMRAFCVPPDPRRSMLGMAQERWLEEGIARCARQKKTWNILVQQSRFSPANYPEGAGVKASVDRWDSFPEARLRILDALATHTPRNTLVIGGDLHQNWVARVHRNPYDVNTPVIASEFTGTSLSSYMGRKLASAQEEAARNPHCLLADPTRRGYGVVTLTPEHATVDLRVLEDVRDPDSSIATLARFVVEDGKPLRRMTLGG
ncbi:MAG: alkaline phosphatase D family protein [Magnetococcales bacterium]|nr:alkaline phosphatase D family protein [Magnetococcales bacterium]